MTTQGTNGASAGWNTDDLRAAVRAVIREVLPEGLPDSVLAGLPGGARVPGPGSVVSVSTDAELDALVRQVASLCEDPDRRAALLAGSHAFRLDRADPGEVHGSRRPQVAESGEVRVERGAVTERIVVKAAKAGSRVVLGPKAVLTPLARDRARALGVEIEKER